MSNRNFNILLLLFLLPCSVFAGIEDVREMVTPFKGSTLFVPNDGKSKHPSIIFFHGSEGGMNSSSRNQAKEFAKNGFATLFFCYFDCDLDDEDVAELHNVELNKSLDAFNWLKSHKLTSIKAGVYGVSRGAEKALIFTTLLLKKNLKAPDFVAVHAPYDKVVSGFNPNWYRDYCYSVDSRGDKKWDNDCGSRMPSKKDSIRYPAWIYKGSTSEVRPWSRIKIENYKGPIFITHGKKDKIWPSEKSKAIERSLLKTRDKKSGLPKPELHLFRDQGHVFQGKAEKKRWSLLMDFLQSIEFNDLE